MNEKPNILFVCTDQQRFDTVAAHGNPHIKTPVLDRLVAEGTTFIRAYSNCPVCVPARYSMFTGLAPHRASCVDNGPTVPRTSFVQRLSEAGYETHGVGKMHFTFDGQNNLQYLWGFDSRDTSEEVFAKDDYSAFLQKNGYGHVHDVHGVRSEMYYIPQPSQLPANLHHSSWVVDRSLDFLKRRDTRKPFMLMTSFIKPHPPFETPTPWNKLYRGPDMPLPKKPEGWEHLITYWNRYQNRYKYRDRGTDLNLVRSMIAAYYSCISFIDFQLGRLMEHLETEGLLENTLIVYTSDHGEMLGDYNCVGKRSFLDSAARIPMIVRGPGMCSGKQVETPVSLPDLFPTFMDAAGIQADEREELAGASLFRLADGSCLRETVFGQFQQLELGLYMAVDKQFKYIYSAPDQREWLFDLVKNPDETLNVAENALYVLKTEEMRNRLIHYFRKESYLEPIDGDAWRLYPVREMPKDPDAGLLFQDPPASIPHIPGYETISSSRL